MKGSFDSRRGHDPRTKNHCARQWTHHRVIHFSASGWGGQKRLLHIAVRIKERELKWIPTYDFAFGIFKVIFKTGQERNSEVKASVRLPQATGQSDTESISVPATFQSCYGPF